MCGVKDWEVPDSFGACILVSESKALTVDLRARFEAETGETMQAEDDWQIDKDDTPPSVTWTSSELKNLCAAPRPGSAVAPPPGTCKAAVAAALPVGSGDGTDGPPMRPPPNSGKATDVAREGA